MVNKGGRQLTESIFDQFHISNPNDYIDLVEDWDSRTPIALPVTSHEGVMVISSACTYGTKKMKES